MKGLLVPLLLVLLCDASFAEEKHWTDHGIPKFGMTPAQESVFEETISAIGMLEPKKVAIGAPVYFRLSRFGRLFGFSFDGQKLQDWLLHRMKTVTHANTWTIATNDNGGDFSLGDRFFEKSDFLERAYALIHEARHSDGGGHPHVRCPSDFKQVSAGTPEIDVTAAAACDDEPDGAYAFQSAFLFELYARDMVDQQEAGLLYNSSVARILGKQKK